jgi:hypothetical protein
MTVFCFHQTIDGSVIGQLAFKSVTPPDDETMTNKSGLTARKAKRYGSDGIWGRGLPINETNSAIRLCVC